jgi:hypothetical protein
MIYNTRTLEQQMSILADKQVRNFPVICCRSDLELLGFFGMWVNSVFEEAYKLQLSILYM